jgi:hypothetical protein
LVVEYKVHSGGVRTSFQPLGKLSPSGKGRGCYERLRAAPRTTPSISTPPDTDDPTRHEADRQADVASERYDEQHDPCDNEPLLCIRQRSHLINKLQHCHHLLD